MDQTVSRMLILLFSIQKTWTIPASSMLRSWRIIYINRAAMLSLYGGFLKRFLKTLPLVFPKCLRGIHQYEPILKTIITNC